jgi:enoyl-CoA hydratase/carnithine racemase
MKEIRFDVAGHVATLTINRPQAYNAMGSQAHLQLSQALDAIQEDDNIRVVVLTGEGEKAFSAGRDLKELAAVAQMPEAERQVIEQRWQRLTRLTSRFDFHKPIIARVNGMALGGGFELALACDIIVAADHAVFALPEPRRGLIAMAGGVHRLPRQMPLKLAMGMLLTGRNLSAAQALAQGIVNQVVPLAELDQAVAQWVGDILECAPLSVQATKQMAMDGLAMPLETALNASYPLEALRQHSQDTVEGPKAFAEKRKPVWSGI